MKYIKKCSGILVLGVMLWMGTLLFVHTAYAQPTTLPIPQIGIDVSPAESPEEVVTSLQILFILTIISLAPSILIMMTSFTRIIIVLHFLRSALGTQQMPPNQVLIGLALFLTFFIMSPMLGQINENALQPYTAGQISQEEAIERGVEPLREFMFRQVENKDIALFASIAQMEPVQTIDDIPTRVLMPAFIIGELKKGFMIGFLIYIPFIVVDMIVASTLMSMGMMMLPPVMISLPFKILLFVMVDGWNLVIGNLLQTFR